MPTPPIAGRSKLHDRLAVQPGLLALLEAVPLDGPVPTEDHERLLTGLGIDAAGWERLQTIWDGQARARLRTVAAGGTLASNCSAAP